MIPSGLVIPHAAVLIDTGTVAVSFGGMLTNCPVEIAGVTR